MISVEIDERENLGDVRDQGHLKTCLSQATSLAHRQVQQLETPLSAEALHYFANDGDFDSGCSIPDIQKSLLDRGQPEESECDPFPIGNPNSWKPPTDVDFHKSDSEIIDFVVDAIKDSIRESNFPILGISLPENFYDPEPPWIISGGPTRGGKHAVVAIGLGNKNDDYAILIRNSWGIEWGDSGHAWIDSSFIESHLIGAFIITGGNGS